MTYVPVSAESPPPLPGLETIKIPVEGTEIVPLQELGAYLIDNDNITPDWLEEFWGFEERKIGAVSGLVPYRELMYSGVGRDMGTHPSFGRPYYDLNTHRLMVEGISYRRQKNGTHSSYQGHKIDKGRFFAWMWSRGFLPKGWGI